MVKNFLSIAKMAATVYDREICIATLLTFRHA